MAEDRGLAGDGGMAEDRGLAGDGGMDEDRGLAGDGGSAGEGWSDALASATVAGIWLTSPVRVLHLSSLTLSDGTDKVQTIKFEKKIE